MSEKIYVGSAKKKVVKDFEIITYNYSSKDLETMKSFLNEKGYGKVDILPRREVGKWGETHFVVINDWKPEGSIKNTQKNWSNSQNSGDIPF